MNSPIQTTLDIHENIKEKLGYFLKMDKIPNIIFHGPAGSGKKTILHDFINDIYHNDKKVITRYTMYVNCSFGKGIKFIREELKFFAKTNIQENIFKSIVLLNADKLTVDAQSALRRCIELFNHNTRFFIVIEDKYKLLKPILSRFCEIYVAPPIIDNVEVNLHQYPFKPFSNDWIKKQCKLLHTKTTNSTLTIQDIFQTSEQFYEKGYSGLDLLTLLENHKFMEKTISLEKRYELLICFNKVSKEFRNEKLILLFIFHFLFLSSNHSLENIFFM